jgi:hypothetical protein
MINYGYLQHHTLISENLKSLKNLNVKLDQGGFLESFCTLANHFKSHVPWLLM